jgi:ABC-type phosphate transport system substrate-binding protein
VPSPPSIRHLGVSCLFALSTLGAALLSTGMAPAAARSQGVVVVVNAANPVSTLRRDQISGIFLGKTQRWPSTPQDVLPVDQIDRQPARATFAHDVLGKSLDAIKFYWQEQIFSGRANPPPARASDADVLTYVRSNPGAIGYVAGGVELGSGVKAITITP